MKYLLLFSLFYSVISYGQVYFNIEFDVDSFAHYNSQEGYYSLLYDPEDTVIIVNGIGSSDDSTALLDIPYIAKFDLDGNMLDSTQIHFGNSDLKYWVGQPRSIISERQSNYIISGGIKNGVSDYNGFVLKIDSDLDTVWTRQFGDSANFDLFSSCQMTRDNEYIVAGQTQTYSDFGPSDLNMWLAKVDTSGNLLWQNNFGGSDIENTITVDTTIDGGYILGGWTKSQSSDRDSYIVKTDSLGNLEWEKWYFISGKTDGGGIKSLSNGHFIYFGSTEYVDPSDPLEYAHSAFAMELDDMGNQVWYKEYGYFLPPNSLAYQYHESFVSMDVLSDGYVFLAQGYDPSQLHHTAFIVKTDFSGNEIWKRRYYKRDSTFNYPRSMIVLDSSDILSCGRLSIQDTNQTQAGWLFKTNCIGLFDSPLADAVISNASQNSIIVDNNSLNFVSGAIYWGDNSVSIFDEMSGTLFAHTYDTVGSYTLTILATACNQTDTITFDIESTPLDINEADEEEILLYPNPATDKLNILTNLEEEFEIKVFNQTGKLVKEQYSSTGTATLNISHIESGFYVVQIICHDKHILKKFVKQGQ